MRAKCRSTFKPPVDVFRWAGAEHLATEFPAAAVAVTEFEVGVSGPGGCSEMLLAASLTGLGRRIRQPIWPWIGGLTTAMN